MFGRPDYAIKEAEDLNHVYFEIKIDEKKLDDLNSYLHTYGFDVPKDKVLGSHIVQWQNLKSPIVSLKHNPRNEYQFLVQFCGIRKPLAKGSFTRKFLEDILNGYSAQRVLRCGYIRNYRGDVFCLYDGKDFTLDEKSLQRKLIVEQQIKAKIEEQGKYVDSFRVAIMNR